MASTKHPQGTLEILTQLNTDYLASDQNGDVKRYEQILAEGTRSRVDLAGPNLVARRLTWRGRARLGIVCDGHKEDAHYGIYEITKRPILRSTRVWFELHPRDARQITIPEPKK